MASDTDRGERPLGDAPEAAQSSAGPLPQPLMHFDAAIGSDQSRRAAALGALAAGVAHEFNNLMTIVLSSLEQLARQPLEGRGRDQLARAEWGARQATRLTQQVLSFARETHAIEEVDLNEVIAAFDKMLGHACGDGITLTVELTPQPLPVRLDPGQLELALLNLVRNAADAMSGRGRVLIRTIGHLIDGLDNQSTVEVSVSDTGTGMPPEVVERATDSFFTTKGPGHGTGLGLWLVQRFATACGGKMAIETAVDRGTTISLVFPRGDETTRS